MLYNFIRYIEYFIEKSISLIAMKFFSRSVSTPDVGSITNSGDNATNVNPNDDMLKLQPNNDNKTEKLSEREICTTTDVKMDNSRTQWKHCRDLIESLERFARSVRHRNKLEDDVIHETMLMATEVSKILERLVEIDPNGVQSYEMETRISKAIRDVLRSKLALKFLLIDDTIKEQPSFDKWMTVFISVIENSWQYQFDMFSHGFRDKRALTWWQSKESCLALLLQILSYNRYQDQNEQMDQYPLPINNIHKRKLIELCSKYVKIISFRSNKLIVTPNAMSLCLRCLIQICKQPLALKDRIEILRTIVLPLKRIGVRLETDWKCDWASSSRNPLVSETNNWFYLRLYTIHDMIRIILPLVDELLLAICSDIATLKKVTLFVEQIFDIDPKSQSLDSRGAALEILALLECKVSPGSRADYRALVVDKFVVPMLKINEPNVLKYIACSVISQAPYPGIFLGPNSSRWKNCVKLLIKLARDDNEVYIQSQAHIALAHLNSTGDLGGISSELNTKQMIKWQTDGPICLNSVVQAIIRMPINQLSRINTSLSLSTTTTTTKSTNSITSSSNINGANNYSIGSKLAMNMMIEYLHLMKKTQAIVKLSTLYRQQSLGILVQNLDPICDFLMIALRHQEHKKVLPDSHLPCKILKLLNQIVGDAIKSMTLLQIINMEHAILSCVRTTLDHRGEISSRLRPVALELLKTLTSKLVTRSTFKYLDTFEYMLQYDGQKNININNNNNNNYNNFNRDLYLTHIGPILYNLITLEPKLLIAVPEHLRRILKINLDMMICSDSNEHRALGAKLVEIALLENMDSLTGRRNNFDTQVIEAACILLMENNYQQIINITIHNKNINLSFDEHLETLRSQSDSDFCFQLTNLICMSFGFDLHKTLDTFSKIEMNKKLTKNSLLGYLIKCILDYDATIRHNRQQQHRDCFNPKHGTRIMIRALCSLIRIPNNLRPQCLTERYHQILPRIIGHFEFLHRNYEDNLSILGFTMRFKYSEITYLNWHSIIEVPFLMDSKLERNSQNFKDEIRILRNSLAEIRRTDPAWVDMLLNSLSRSQATLLDDLYNYIKEPPRNLNMKQDNIFKRIHGSFRSSSRRKSNSQRERKRSI